MKLESSKKKASVGPVHDGAGAEALVATELSESYQSQVETRSGRQKPAGGEAPAFTEQVLPAWIKTQMEQLEMRRMARHRLERVAFPPLEKISEQV